MRLLIVAATEPEIAPLLKELKFSGNIAPNLQRFGYGQFTIDVLLTGVGMVATGAWIGRVLAQEQYDAAINAGICGSYDRTIELGEVVAVQSDCMPELGAEDGADFLSIFDLQLLGRNDFPYTNGVLLGKSGETFGILSALRNVTGVTVNRVHGRESSIEELIKRIHPQTESMEGAAFYYACAIADVPAIQIRAVSNYVERRNRANWKIGEAIRNLNRVLLEYLNAQ